MRDALDGIEPKSLEHHHGIKRASSAMRAEETRALQRECSVLAMTAGAVSRAVSDAMSLLSSSATGAPVSTDGAPDSHAPLVSALVRAGVAERSLGRCTDATGGLAGALQAGTSGSAEPLEGSAELQGGVSGAATGADSGATGAGATVAADAQDWHEDEAASVADQSPIIKPGSVDVGPALATSLVALLQAAASLEVPAIASLAALPATAYVGSATSSLTSRTAARAAAAFASLEQASEIGRAHV